VDGTEPTRSPQPVERPGVCVDGRFQLREMLGRGAMGSVFRAYDTQLEREVAIKLLKARDPSPERFERLRREAAAMARLDHPAILKVYSLGIDPSGIAYLVTRVVEGARPLDDVTRELSPAERVERVRQVAEALGVAHSQGVVHRDVKPENVLVDAGGALVLTDFGLALLSDLERLTRSGHIVGTPAYTSPEQLRSDRDEYGPASDVWALGVLLYEALTGERPFDGPNLLELAVKVTQEPPIPPTQLDPDVSPALEAVCLAALSKDPRLRPPDGAAFARAIEMALAPPQSPPGPPTSSPLSAAVVLAAMVFVLLLAVAVGLWARTRASPRDASPAAPVGPILVAHEPSPRPVVGRVLVREAAPGEVVRLNPPHVTSFVRPGPDLLAGLVRIGDDSSSILELHGSRDDGRSWSQWGRLSPARRGALAADPRDGSLHMAFTRRRADDLEEVWYTRWDWVSRQWEEPSRALAAGPGDRFPVSWFAPGVVIDGAGRPVVYGSVRKEWVGYFTRPVSEGWRSPTRIADPAGLWGVNTCAEVGAEGDLHFTYRVFVRRLGPGGRYHVYGLRYRRWDAAADGWGPEGEQVIANHCTDHHVMRLGQDGRIHVLLELRDMSPEVAAATMAEGGPGRLVYAARGRGAAEFRLITVVDSPEYGWRMRDVLEGIGIALTPEPVLVYPARPRAQGPLVVRRIAADGLEEETVVEGAFQSANLLRADSRDGTVSFLAAEHGQGSAGRVELVRLAGDR